LLVSQGDERDGIVIRLKEDFFLTSKSWTTSARFNKKEKKKKNKRRRRLQAEVDGNSTSGSAEEEGNSVDESGKSAGKGGSSADKGGNSANEDDASET